MDKKQSKMINMRYSESFLKRIDKYQTDQGFQNRTDAIRDLIRRSLEIYENKK